VTNYITEEELNNIPLTWYEERQLLRKQQYEAKRAFFSEHAWDAPYQHIHRIPDDLRSELLICGGCRSEATHFQARPYGELFCSSHAREVRRYRRSVWLRNKKFKEKHNTHYMRYHSQLTE
jgi:hypothetical protein